MSKKTNPVVFRINKTKLWNINSSCGSKFISRELILRRYLFYKLKTYKINLLSYHIINISNKVYIYLNALPLKQKSLLKKKYIHKYSRYSILNIFYLYLIKFNIEKKLFDIFKINSNIYFKNNFKFLLENKYKQLKRKRSWNTNKLVLYYFKLGLNFSSTLFFSFFIQSLLKKYKLQTRVFYRVIVSNIKQAFKDNKNIDGIRIKIKGKLNGKQRTKIIIWSIGLMPIQSTNKLIRYSYAYCHNVFGSFGVKFWININD